jgi:hypothetical protein
LTAVRRAGDVGDAQIITLHMPLVWRTSGSGAVVASFSQGKDRLRSRRRAALRRPNSD